MSKGIDGSRITAVGHGPDKPVAPNDTAENREKNRRIEVVERQPG
jgi:chemotaxis protein MotB